MAGTNDARSVSLVDLPLVRRLSDNGIMLHSEIGLTQDARGQNTALLSRILFRRSLHTLVARSDERLVLGQFRYNPDDFNAHIVYLAPRLEAHHENTVWLNILDALAVDAGKHGAHTLIAEVEPNSYLFETMRCAGYAVYMRQHIWRHGPAHFDSPLSLAEETANDQIDILALINNTVPQLLHQIAAPSADMSGLVYRRQSRIEGYVAISEGKQGIYLLPYIHPDAMDQAVDILAAALQHTRRAHKVPVYVAIRSYQDWLDTPLHALGFDDWLEQAVLVKHLAARLHQANFSNVKIKTALETARGILPPASPFATIESESEELPNPYGTTYNG